MARTGLLYSKKMLLHDTGLGHPERAARLTAILEAFEAAGLAYERLPITPATRDDLHRVHSEAHVESVHQTCALGRRYPDPDTPMVAASWEAALLSAGAAITACRAVVEGGADNAFCAIRPPGHHAEHARAMGFCMFNNVAIAARWLKAKAGVERIAIFDWDVHHGNGTQQAFYTDPTVYYASIHQHPFYPGTGWPHERGEGNTNLNIQMAHGSEDEQWLEAFHEKVMPELEAFGPDFVLLSAGFDAHRLDPLGGQMLETETFVEMTHGIKTLAKGRLVSVLEGGYSLEALADATVAHFRALQGGPGDQKVRARELSDSLK